MKYIRTKDGIFKILDYSTNCGESYYQIKSGNHGWIWTCSDDILKEADTIEELCDDFVSVSKYGYTKPVGDVVSWNYVKTKARYDVEYIYGAIWTDKGLIYVAKMNEKGVFELL